MWVTAFLAYRFSQNLASFPSSFGENIGQDNVFYDILERENGFVGYKNKKFKNSKNWYFSKKVSPLFRSKMGLFSIFSFLCNKGKENVFTIF